VSLAAEIVKINPETPDMRLVSYVAARIKAGQVVGMPTDTFYGLAADPLNLRAVDLIYDVKSRSRHKPLSLLIESVEQAEELAKRRPDNPELMPLVKPPQDYTPIDAALPSAVDFGPAERARMGEEGSGATTALSYSI